MVICFVLGCEPDTETRIIVTVKEEFNIQMWENLAADDRSLQIDIETIEDLDCENYVIEHNLSKNNERISIDINEIVRPDNCILAQTPAQLSVPLGFLLHGQKNFEINLSDKAVINKGILKVSEEAYTLEMETKNGFRLHHPVLNRVPRKTIWGSLQLDKALSENERQDALKLLDEIKALSEEKLYIKGYYGYFSIDALGKISMDVDSNLPDPLPKPELFILEYQSHSINELKSILEYYRNVYPEQLEVQVFTWDGLKL